MSVFAIAAVANIQKDVTRKEGAIEDDDDGKRKKNFIYDYHYL